VLGFSSDLQVPANVSTESPRQLPEITMHERLHQLSDPRAAELLGTQRYEGVTQDLTLKALGQEPAIGEATGYPEQRALAHKLRKLCGDGAIEKVYFQGDPTELKACLERNLGNGGVERLRKKLQAPP